MRIPDTADLLCAATGSPDTDVIRLRLMERHPLYDLAETDDYTTAYRHQVTGREVRYDPHENRFVSEGYLGAVRSRIRGLLRDERWLGEDAERVVFTADDYQLEELEATLDAHLDTTGLMAGRRYDGDGYRVVFEDDALAADEVALDIVDEPPEDEIAAAFRELAPKSTGLSQTRRDGEWITMDPDRDPYAWLNDARRRD